DLVGQVARHRVDVVGQVFPRAGDAAHFGLTAKLAFRADFARDARDFGRERVQLVHHRVHGVFESENFSSLIYGDFAREVAVRSFPARRSSDLDLVGQVARHRVDVVGQVFPRAGDASHFGLTAELAFGADLARDTRDLGR